MSQSKRKNKRINSLIIIVSTTFFSIRFMRFKKSILSTSTKWLAPKYCTQNPQNHLMVLLLLQNHLMVLLFELKKNSKQSQNVPDIYLAYIGYKMRVICSLQSVDNIYFYQQLIMLIIIILFRSSFNLSD